MHAVFGSKARQRPWQWAENMWAAEKPEVETSCEVDTQHMRSDRSDNALKPVLSASEPHTGTNFQPVAADCLPALFWEHICCLLDCLW